MAASTWRGRLLALALSTALALGLAELGLRLFWVKRLVLGAGIEHPHFHHRLLPRTDYHFKSDEFDVTIRTNSYGLRGPDPAIPKPAGVLRILLLGDSYTFGFPVRDEDTFAARLERGLRDQGLPIEVVNGGVSGYSPTLHYISLRDQYLAFEPDLVILWMDLGDPQEDAWFQKNLVRNAQGGIARCDPRYINGRYSLWESARRHSALFKYLDQKLLRTVHKIQVLGLRRYLATKLKGERSKVAMARLKSEQKTPDLVEYDRFLLVRETSTPAFIAPYWELTASYVRKIQALLQERQVPLVIGVYPYGMLAGPDQWSAGRSYWGFEPGRTYDASAALEVFEKFCHEAGLPLVNTFDRFKDAARTEKLFYDQDGHFTPAGHRVLAEAALQDPAFRHAMDSALAAYRDQVKRLR